MGYLPWDGLVVARVQWIKSAWPKTWAFGGDWRRVKLGGSLTRQPEGLRCPRKIRTLKDGPAEAICALALKNWLLDLAKTGWKGLTTIQIPLIY